MSRQSRPQTAREVREKEHRLWWRSITRDLVLFTVGLLLLLNEVFFHKGAPRESLLVIYAGCLGLPAILRADERRRRNGDGE